MKKQSKGFTLVELLIVIAILAILYGMAAVNVMGIQNEAKMSKAKGDLRTLQLAMDSYVSRHSLCPDVADYQKELTRQNPGILSGHLYDPFARSVNTPYAYNKSLNRYNFVLYSVGMVGNGSAEVGDDGKIYVTGSPIFVSNGYF